MDLNWIADISLKTSPKPTGRSRCFDQTRMSQPEGVPFSEIVEDVVLIAVMGVTGSGKSSFVKLVTGSEEVVVGNDLNSCILNTQMHLLAID